MRKRLVLPLLIALLTISTALADAPTLADLDQLFKQADYAGVVKGCSAALEPGGASDPGDRYKIASLKGEAQLRLRQSDAAIDAFTAAAKETQDARLASLATTTATLIKRSKDFVYTSETIKPPIPKVPPRPVVIHIVTPTTASTRFSATKPVQLPVGQFDIIESQHRTAALAALWTDTRSDTEHQVKDDIAKKALPALNDALDAINQAQPIAVTGGNSDWPQAQKDSLASAARADVNNSMKDMNAQLVTIVKEQAKRRHGQHPKPMPQPERDQINQMTQALDQYTESLKSLTTALNVDPAEFKPELDHAAQLQDRATTVLATD